MTPIPSHELQEIYAFAIELGKEAGRMLMAAAQMRMGDAATGLRQEHVQKENAVDLVTETDEGTSLDY